MFVEKILIETKAVTWTFLSPSRPLLPRYLLSALKIFRWHYFLTFNSDTDVDESERRIIVVLLSLIVLTTLTLRPRAVPLNFGS